MDLIIYRNLDKIAKFLVVALIVVLAGHVIAGGLPMIAVKFIYGVIIFAAICWAPLLLSYVLDRWNWNGGICRKTGLPWEKIQQSDGRIRLRSLHVVKHIGRWFGSEEYC